MIFFLIFLIGLYYFPLLLSLIFFFPSFLQLSILCYLKNLLLLDPEDIHVKFITKLSHHHDTGRALEYYCNTKSVISLSTQATCQSLPPSVHYPVISSQLLNKTFTPGSFIFQALLSFQSWYFSFHSCRYLISACRQSQLNPQVFLTNLTSQ